MDTSDNRASVWLWGPCHPWLRPKIWPQGNLGQHCVRGIMPLTALRVMIPGGCGTSGYRNSEIATKKNFFLEYLRENSWKFLLIHEKNQSSKISCYCPFQLALNVGEERMFSFSILCMIYFLWSQCYSITFWAVDPRTREEGKGCRLYLLQILSQSSSHFSWSLYTQIYITIKNVHAGG